MNSPLEQNDRNRQICLDKASGMTFRELSKKYDLSINRLQFIVQREKQKGLGQAPAPASQVPNLDSIRAVIAQHRQTLQQEFKVKDLAVFGSVARGEAKPNSDIDLLVEFEQPIGLFKFASLQEYLERILGRQVDLGTPKSLKPIIRDEVLNQMIYV